MNEIKSLADQLRERMRTGEAERKAPSAKDESAVPASTARPKKNPTGQKAEAFFRDIEAFKIEVSEKSMIRVDVRTVNLLKRIKLVKGIDMNRFIVYALHQYLSQHPWLPGHIQETLKKSEP